MATQITITKVDYPNTADAGQTWTVEYKTYDSPTWILAANNKVANVNGTFSSSLVISGLVSGQLYYTRMHNNCSSPVEYYIQEIQL